MHDGLKKLAIQPVVGNTHNTRVERAVSSVARCVANTHDVMYGYILRNTRCIMADWRFCEKKHSRIVLSSLSESVAGIERKSMSGLAWTNRYFSQISFLFSNFNAVFIECFRHMQSFSLKSRVGFCSVVFKVLRSLLNNFCSASNSRSTLDGLFF